jgi:hypothetical protein
MHKITVSHDGTLTRAGAALMRENGVAGVSGSTTLTQARAAARKAGVTFEFVSATNERKVVKAKRARKVQPTIAAQRKVTAWECGHASLREHIAARCDGSKASA